MHALVVPAAAEPAAAAELLPKYAAFWQLQPLL
jgi:hypothetical protein